MNIQDQETQRVSHKINPKWPNQDTSYLKCQESETKREPSESKRKAVSYLQGSLHKTTDFFLNGTLQARKDWHKLFKVMKSKDLQPRLLYPAKLLFRTKGQIKSFPDKKKTKGRVNHHQIITTRNVKGT